jgi:hypothetical protein
MTAPPALWSRIVLDDDEPTGVVIETSEDSYKIRWDVGGGEFRTMTYCNEVVWDFRPPGEGTGDDRPQLQ